jgi:lysyl-tRNA synthetase class 2
MSEQLNEHQVRVQKLHALRAAWINTYITKFERSHSTKELHSLVEGKELPKSEELYGERAQSLQYCRKIDDVPHAWEVVLLRCKMGVGQIQIAWIKDLCKLVSGTELLSSLSIDGQEWQHISLPRNTWIWVILSVWEELFVTNHGELTLLVNEFQLLSKALRPLGDKRHSVEDLEKDWEKRYLDTTMNTEARDMLHRRSKFWQSMRSFLLQEGFISKTPVLEMRQVEQMQIHL